MYYSVAQETRKAIEHVDKGALQKRHKDTVIQREILASMFICMSGEVCTHFAMCVGVWVKSESHRGAQLSGQTGGQVLSH